ncbi:MAG: DinB family protein [Pseudoxanthomonas sp.]
MNHLQTLTRYKAWADELFLSTVSQLPHSEMIAPRPIVFGSMIRTLHHSYAMDRVWQAHLLGEEHGYKTRNPNEHPVFEELREKQLAMDAWYVGYADSLDADQWNQIVDFEFIGGGSGSMSRNDILLHVVNHTTYHRGHVADMLYHLSVFPPTTDLPVFLRQIAIGA